MAPRDFIGDEAARSRLESLWAAHYTDLLAFAFRRVGDRLAAEDVVAETFLVAWRRVEAIPTDEARTWLFAVANKVIANSRRSRQRGDALLARLEQTGNGSCHQLEADSLGVVVAAFNRLSRADRRALALVVWEELAPREAALVLRISAGAFSVRLHRAKERLRHEIRAGDPRPTDVSESRLASRPGPAPAKEPL